MRTPIGVLAALLLVVSPVRADEIRMKNGSILFGRIVQESKDSVTIDIGQGRMNIARRNIVSILKTAPESAPSDGSGADAPPKSTVRRPAPEPAPESQAARPVRNA